MAPAPAAPSRGFYTFARWAVAVLVIVYGFGKLSGAQFTILDSELDKPLGEVSGFWLTWHYYGYSAWYGGILAATQIASGLLLTFRRTTLVAALILFAMTVNIVLVDIFYGVDLGGLLAAMVILSLLVVVLAHHRTELARTFWPARTVPGESEGRSPVAVVRAVVGRALLLIVPAVFTWWVANYNNRAPTPLDGAWGVTSWDTAAARASDAQPTALYFERNRAHMAVVRYPDRWVQHHFEVDSARGAVQIWERWLAKGAVVFEGEYRLEGDRLSLDGEWSGLGPVHLELARRGAP